MCLFLTCVTSWYKLYYLKEYIFVFVLQGSFLIAWVQCLCGWEQLVAVGPVLLDFT